jgi:CRP/FNR family transcriptional regulator
MSDSVSLPIQRPEFVLPLERGDAKISSLLRGSAFALEGGRTLIETDTDHAFVYRLVEGWAGLARGMADGRRQFALIFLPGDLFLVDSMFVTVHTHAVQTLSRIVAERIDRRDLYRAYAQDSDIATRCTWQIVEETRRLRSWVVTLGQGSAEQRLATILLDFQGRLAISGFVAKSSLSYQMPLTQVQLADHLGLTAVHVNRVLRSFREEGLAFIREGRVTIADPDGLAERAASLLQTCKTSLRPASNDTA